MKLRWWWLLTVAACVAGASAETSRVEITAVGDTLNVSTFFTKKGGVDSVLTTITSPRTATTSKWTVNSPSLVAIIPSPALVAGEVLTGQGCVMGMVKGKPTPSQCQVWTYTRPGVVLDSTVVSFQLWPDTITVIAGDTARYMTVALFGDGHTETYMRDYWVGHEAGVQTVWATLGGKIATSRIRVLSSVRESAGYIPFARHAGSYLPPYPLATRANECNGTFTQPAWCGRWL